ncbi:MAG: multicopper oxidase domain-containing protein, partial [Microbacterium sp.]
ALDRRRPRRGWGSCCSFCFEDYADPTMPYMYHCHMLLHEDEGMMGQFVVIEPGDEEAVAVPERPAHVDDSDDAAIGGHGGH